MAICTKINTAGTTLQNNLNARGVSCTYGKNSESKQTIKDMADLITSSNLKGSADSIIHISASRPYLLEDETTDLIVTLHNGVGTPLANKSITISDGTSVYSGITNSLGTFTLYDLTVSSNTTFTATYSISSATCTVYSCSFADYATSTNNTNWDTVVSTVEMTRQDSYTELKMKPNASSFGYIFKNLSITDNITIEFDLKQATTPSTNLQYFSFRDVTGVVKLGISRDYQGLNDSQWHHYRFVVNGLTVTPYIDGVQKSNLTLSGNFAKIQIEARSEAVNHFKNFAIY